MESILKNIQSLIVRGDDISAKAQLLEYLDIHPQSGDAWWLVSLLADNDADGQLALEQCLSCDPSHYEAKRALNKITQKTKTASATLKREETANRAIANRQLQADSAEKRRGKASPSSQKAKAEAQNQPSPILNSVVEQYIKDGWEIDKFSPQELILKKKTGLAWGIALILAVIIPVLGWVIFFANLFMRREHKLKLVYLPHKRSVQVSGRSVKNGLLDWDHIRRGHLPTPSTNYFSALIGGLVVTLGLCGALVAFVMIAGTNVTESLEIGDTGYINHPDTGVCHSVYLTADLDNPLADKYPNGTMVKVENVRQELGEDAWYRISVDEEIIGWIPVDYVTADKPSITTPVNFCQ